LRWKMDANDGAGLGGSSIVEATVGKEQGRYRTSNPDSLPKKVL